MTRTVFNYQPNDGFECGDKGEPHWWTNTPVVSQPIVAVNVPPQQYVYAPSQHAPTPVGYAPPPQPGSTNIVYTTATQPNVPSAPPTTTATTTTTTATNPGGPQV